jgi:hypothetical protein
LYLRTVTSGNLVGGLAMGSLPDKVLPVMVQTSRLLKNTDF